MLKRVTLVVMLLVLLGTPALGAKKRVELGEVEISPSTAEEVLGLFTGRIKKLKTVDSGRPKSTTAVELNVDGDKSNTIGMVCEADGMFVKGIGYPYAALVMVFPIDNKFPSGRKVSKTGLSCMLNWVPGIQGMSASSVKKTIFQEGVGVARLFLISYSKKGPLQSDMPTKIGP